jgi:hypothetical protein
MEPERPIEKLLRAFSKKRRNQAGQFELHPATRNLLQGEVLRELGDKDQTNQWFLVRFWRQFAYGFGMFAVLGIIAYFVFLSPTGNSSSELAQAPVMQAAAPPASSLAPEPSVFFRDSQTNGIAMAAVAPKPAARDEEMPAAPAVATVAANPGARGRITNPLSPVPANEPAPSVATADAKLVDRSRTDVALSARRAVMPAEAKAKAETETEADVTANLAKKELADKAVTLTAAYQRTSTAENRIQNAPAGEVRQQAPATVLAAFRVERIGDAIKITDSDGSIYNGRIVAAVDEPVRRLYSADTNSTRETLVQSKALKIDAVAQPVFFVVKGTNISLNRNVVFSGRFSPPPPSASFGLSLNGAGATGGAAPTAKRAAPAASALPPITGKLKVEDGNQREISIEAKPTGP